MFTFAPMPIWPPYLPFKMAAINSTFSWQNNFKSYVFRPEESNDDVKVGQGTRIMFSGNKLINRYKLYHSTSSLSSSFPMLQSSSFAQLISHKQSSVQGKLFLLQEHFCVEQFVQHGI